jgi:hypothetical protein
MHFLLLLVAVYAHTIDIGGAGDTSFPSCTPFASNTVPFAHSAVCVENSTCNSGLCLPSDNATVCICRARWGEPDCSYEMKSRLDTFLLSIFLGPWFKTTAHTRSPRLGNMLTECRGADRFFVGDVTVGVVKLMLTVTAIISPCFPLFYSLCWHENGVPFCGSGSFSLLCWTAVTIWWIVDFAMVAAGSMTDNNGIDLWNDF